MAKMAISSLQWQEIPIAAEKIPAPATKSLQCVLWWWTNFYGFPEESDENQRNVVMCLEFEWRKMDGASEAYASTSILPEKNAWFGMMTE